MGSTICPDQQPVRRQWVPAAMGQAAAEGEPQPGREAPPPVECGGSTLMTLPESKLDPSQSWSCPSFSSPAFSCFTSGENTIGRRRRQGCYFVTNFFHNFLIYVISTIPPNFRS